MKELKVLALVGKEMKNRVSLRSLKNLRTLCLDGSNFDGTSTDVIGSLENLEILSFRDCYSMRELPREIGRLKQLRLLDTTNCEELEVIPHGIFSSLCRLEELYMVNSFNEWEIGRGREEKGMASISEVMSLSDHLKVLAIEIPSVIHLLTKDIVLKSPTIRFLIRCATWGRLFSEMSTYAFENCLEISESDARELEESQAVRLLLKKSKKLYLSEVKNFSVLTDLDQEGFQDLKDLDLWYCPHIEYLANGTSGFLTNLRFLKLGSCGVLKYVFSLSAARNLVQLQELNIDGCDQMEEIVSKQGEHEEEADMISFDKLTNLTLEGLGSLVGFFQAKKLYSNQEETTARVEHQSAGVFEKAIFPSKCISWFPSLEEVVLGRMKFEGVLFDLKNIPSGFQGFQNSRLPKKMHVKRCENLKTMGAVIPQRKKLENNLKKDSTSHDFSTSPTRSSNWCPAGCGCAPYSRPNAHRPIEILPRPIKVTPTNLEDSNDNDNLENLTVSDCNSMEVIFQLKGPKHEESSHSIEAFNKLSSLRLDRLPGLTRVWEMGSSQPMLTGSSFGNLKSLEVGFCNQLKYLFSSSIVKLLVSIEDIEVHNCEKMEEIVAAEEETDETITLPKVKSIKLESLPKLKYFCGEAYTLKLPSLELLEVDDVQNLSLLAPKLIATHPRLQVRTALGVAEWKGDLNATLRNIYVTRKGEDDEIEREDEHN
ncbi:uncharacterized protein LOC126589108 [Malus sylvestris]|uniref:uncharacterized protein LOC126589108 n=1 Tax=Malus sylvestris TaxID=3752 RepID=UPI0021ABABEB|nr:uncharacterized protein LOC126589108 [Malus sylvestris]XP_050110267.1 uncharacterized protein LOC126589108 [Malus sylvestris]XP_050110268.1 uncharacterized protein LOC126589108 [Malus sylvestris]